ncbi:hypothetical protein ACFX2J_032321 [Malus domestica]
MASEDDCENKICLDDAFNESKNAFSAENSVSDGHSDEPFFPWKLELESLFMVECQGISGERHGKLL